MSETKPNSDEKPNDDEPRPTNPPPYTNPPNVPVTNQPQMSVIYATQGPGTHGAVVMATGQPGTMTAVAPGIIVLNQMMYQPMPYQCNSCHQQIVTKIKRKPTFKTHFFAAAFCIVCFLPCAIIPYCMDGCRQADHYCPNCDSFIGSYVP